MNFFWARKYGIAPEPSRDSDSDNREPSGDRFPKDPYPKVEFSVREASTSADSDREETSHSTLQQFSPLNFDCKNISKYTVFFARKLMLFPFLTLKKAKLSLQENVNF